MPAEEIAENGYAAASPVANRAPGGLSRGYARELITTFDLAIRPSPRTNPDHEQPNRRDPLPVPTMLGYASQPDEPMHAALADAQVEPATWGRVPRTDIRTALGRAQPPALQDHMIAEADQLTRADPLEVHTARTWQPVAREEAP